MMTFTCTLRVNEHAYVCERESVVPVLNSPDIRKEQKPMEGNYQSVFHGGR